MHEDWRTALQILGEKLGKISTSAGWRNQQLATEKVTVLAAAANGVFLSEFDPSAGDDPFDGATIAKTVGAITPPIRVFVYDRCGNPALQGEIKREYKSKNGDVWVDSWDCHT